jgi:hypothetical protein
LEERAGDHPEVLASVCSLCHMQERAAALTVSDRAAILAALDRGRLLAVKEAQRRLGCSISDAVSLVHAIRKTVESGP